MGVFNCITCNKEFASGKACKNRVPKYCSKGCYAESIKKYKACAHCGKQYADFTKKVYCSLTCQRGARKGKALPIEWRQALSEGRKRSDKCKGPNLYNWKGGASTHAERMRLHSQKRRSAQSIEIDAGFMQRLYAAQNGRCFYCECDISQYKAIEHLTPLSRGGDNFKYNMVYACKSCNSKKRSKTLEEFAIANRRFDWIDKYDLIFPKALYAETD